VLRTVRVLGYAAIAIAGCSLAACGTLLSISDEPPPSALDGGQGQDGTVGEAGAASDGAVVPADAQVDGPLIPLPACITKRVTILVSADTGPIIGACNTMTGYGIRPYAVLSTTASFLLTKFFLPSEVATAIRGGDLRGMSLVLTADPTCAGETCPPITAGVVEAHVMRNDWEEGVSDTNYSGADWCRKATGAGGAGWGTGANNTTPIGAVDYSVSLGAQMFGALAPSATILLAQQQVVASWIQTFGGSSDPNLSFFVRATMGTFVVAEKALGGANPNAPKLVVDYCAPDGG